MTDITVFGMCKFEFREVARRLCPDLTDEEFDDLWDEFMHERWIRSLH